MVTVIDVPVFVVIDAGIPSKVTVLAAVRLVPVTVTVVPPASGPDFGEITVTFGTAI